MDFDPRLARYFMGLMRSLGGTELYDVQCFDANMPPINSEKYANREFTQNCIVNHLALNTTLQDLLHE